MTDENDGILGKLPRSRPGVRSDKRASSGKRGPKAPAKPKATARPKAPRKAAAPPPPPPPREPEPEPVAAAQPADPVGMALKAGETVARTGIKVAGRVAGEVLRRLPRP